MRFVSRSLTYKPVNSIFAFCFEKSRENEAHSSLKSTLDLKNGENTKEATSYLVSFPKLRLCNAKKRTSVRQKADLEGDSNCGVTRQNDLFCAGCSREINRMARTLEYEDQICYTAAQVAKALYESLYGSEIPSKPIDS